jgi:hypothetical protein
MPSAFYPMANSKEVLIREETTRQWGIEFKEVDL